MQCRQPTVWSNSRSGSCSAPKSAVCVNGSCVATTSRYAFWTDSSRMLLCKSELRRARRRDGNFIRRTVNRGEVGTLGQHAWYDSAPNFVLGETNRQKASPNFFKFAIRQQRLRWYHYCNEAFVSTKLTARKTADCRVAWCGGNGATHNRFEAA